MKPTQKSKETKSTKKGSLPWSLSSLDLLGGSLTFTLHTITGKFQTTIGSLLTLLMLGFSIGVFVLLYIQYLDTSDPVVTQSTEFITEPMTLNLLEGLMIFPYSLIYRGKYQFVEEMSKFITIKGFLVEKTFIKEKNKFEYTSIQRFDFKPCRDYKDKRLYKEFFDSSNSGTLHKYILCPDIEDFPERGQVTTSPSGLSSKTIYIKFYPCSLPDRTQCQAGFSPDSASASILTPFWKPDSANYTEPLHFSAHSFVADFNSKVKRIFTYDIRKHRILDVLDEYQGEKLRREYLVPHLADTDEISKGTFETHCPESEMTFLSKTCENFLTIHLVPLPEIITLRRNYKKLTELSGEFGGIMKIGSVLFIFYVIYNAKAKKMMLAREVFGYNKEKSSRVGPKRQVNNQQRQKKLGSGSQYQSKTPKDIAKESVREALKVKNFVDKMNFMKLLRNILTDENDEELIDLINLKQQIPNTSKNKGEAKPSLENSHLSSNENQNQRTENILETELWSLLQDSARVGNTKKFDKKPANIQPQEKNSTARWMFVDADEDEDHQGSSHNKNNKSKIVRKKLVLESAKLNAPQGEEAKKPSLWTINESEQEAKINQGRSSPLSSASPKRRFKRGITPFSIRVKQKNSKSSNDLEGNEKLNSIQ